MFYAFADTPHLRSATDFAVVAVPALPPSLFPTLSPSPSGHELFAAPESSAITLLPFCRTKSPTFLFFRAVPDSKD